MRSGRKKGFTLIELLTVVVIIGILASLLFSVFFQARTRARKNRCAAETRELAKAWQAYFSTYNSLPGLGTMNGAAVQMLQGDNAKGIKFMDFSMSARTTGFLDPWGKPYRIALSVRGTTNQWEYSTRVYLLNERGNQYE